MLDFNEDKPIIGVVHLLPLPGSPGFESLEPILTRALSDAKSLIDGGVDGLIIENYGDRPFMKRVSKMTVSSFSMVCAKIEEMCDLPMGINVLRNDWESALSMAKSLGSSFVRVNVYIGCCITPEGIMEGEAGNIMRFRKKHDIDASIFADIQVKHADVHYPKDMVTAAVEASERGMVDALIVSGKRTGKPVDLEDLEKAKYSVDVPVLVGSGIDDKNVKEVLNHSDGAIVGTYFKEDGVTSNPVSEERVKHLLKEIERYR